MTRLSAVQIAAYAAGAGFTGPGLNRAVAVALAESGGRTDAVGVNHDTWRSRDRGLWQINSHWHPEVSDAQAFNPAACASAAYAISHGGRDWSAWSTWKNGTAAAQMGRARLAVAQFKRGGGSTSTTATNVNGFGIPSVPSIPGLPTLPVNPLDPFGLIPDAGDLFPGGGSGLGGGGGLLGGTLGAANNAATALAQTNIMLAHAAVWMSDPHNWTRVAMVIGGGVGLLLGVSMLAKSGAAGSTAQAAGAISGKAAAAAVPLAKLGKAAKAAATK